MVVEEFPDVIHRQALGYELAANANMAAVSGELLGNQALCLVFPDRLIGVKLRHNLVKLCNEFFLKLISVN